MYADRCEKVASSSRLTVSVIRSSVRPTTVARKKTNTGNVRKRSWPEYVAWLRNSSFIIRVTRVRVSARPLSI